MNITKEILAMMKMALVLNGDHEEDLKDCPNKIAAVCNQVFGWETDDEVISGLLELIQVYKTRDNILKDIKKRHMFTLRDKDKGMEISLSFLKGSY